MNPRSWLRSLSTLQLALGASVAVHAALLTVRFVDPARFDRIFQDTPLEVVLVNARSNERPPEQAQAIAQAALAGGGDADTGRATSPLPPSALTSVGNDMDDQQRQVEAMLQQQNQMLAELRAELATLPPPDPRADPADPQTAAREERRRQFVDLLAEIERRIQEENARPRKRYLSPATREAVYALYYDALRRRIEDRGTEQFPSDGGQKLYGELTMTITVGADGRVLDTDVIEPSPSRALNRAAQLIVRGAGPFGPFSEAMRRKADQIVVVSRFRFTRDATLETRLNAAP